MYVRLMWYMKEGKGKEEKIKEREGKNKGISVLLPGASDVQQLQLTSIRL